MLPRAGVRTGLEWKVKHKQEQNCYKDLQTLISLQKASGSMEAINTIPRSRTGIRQDHLLPGTQLAAVFGHLHLVTKIYEEKKA